MEEENERRSYHAAKKEGTPVSGLRCRKGRPVTRVEAARTAEGYEVGKIPNWNGPYRAHGKGQPSSWPKAKTEPRYTQSRRKAVPAHAVRSEQLGQ